jgi:hypothetical protein
MLLVTAGPCRAAGAPLPEDCFDVLENGKGAEIACTFPLRLTEQERADLKKATRGYLDDLNCIMTIRIDRAKVDEAIRAADLVFQVPEQPVSCTVTTPNNTFDVTATFSPRVVFKRDKAVQASPGLANVKGVSRVLAWPVVLYVNYGPGMRAGLLQVVNAYRTFARKKAADSAGAPQSHSKN